MDFFNAAGSALAYVVVGVVMLVLGYVMTDITTPGKLTSLIYKDRSANASIIAGSNLVAIGVIVNVAIWTTHADFWTGLWQTSAFGILGVVVLAVADYIIDWITPGDLHALTNKVGFHPAAAVIGVNHLVIGTIIAASIS